MAYRVVAPYVLAKDPDGRIHHTYRGEVVEWTGEPHLTSWLAQCLVEAIPTDPAAADQTSNDSTDTWRPGI